MAFLVPITRDQGCACSEQGTNVPAPILFYFLLRKTNIVRFPVMNLCPVEGKKKDIQPYH